jgi:hypothetical protein
MGLCNGCSDEQLWWRRIIRDHVSALSLPGGRETCQRHPHSLHAKYRVIDVRRVIVAGMLQRGQQSPLLRGWPVSSTSIVSFLTKAVVTVTSRTLSSAPRPDGNSSLERVEACWVVPSVTSGLMLSRAASPGCSRVHTRSPRRGILSRCLRPDDSGSAAQGRLWSSAHRERAP